MDERDTDDRRNFSWRTVTLGFLRSRRKASRRYVEGPPVFSDSHHPWLMFLAISTMLLSGLDAFFTLQLLDRGFYEANPFMGLMLGHGVFAFSVSKMLLTGLGVLMLVYMARHRFMNRFRSGLVLTTMFSFYACRVCYEFGWLIRDL
jgi:hypothetical protein